MHRAEVVRIEGNSYRAEKDEERVAARALLAAYRWTPYSGAKGIDP
jgi:hypothetical protein